MQYQIDQKEVSLAKAQSTKALTAVNQIVVTTQEEYQVASTLRTKINQTVKFIKEKKEGITKPLNEARKNVIALFAPIETASREALGILDFKMIEYSNRVEEEASVEQEKLARRAERGTLKPETAVKKMGEIEQAPTHVENKFGSTSTRVVKEVEYAEDFVDQMFKALVKGTVPREYFKIDLIKVRRDVLDGCHLPGAKVVENKKLSSR